jgi:starvation-inducible DNA-binding protein
VLTGFQELLKIEREVLILSAGANDEGTNVLLSDYIREQEKICVDVHSVLKKQIAGK